MQPRLDQRLDTRDGRSELRSEVSDRTSSRQTPVDGRPTILCAIITGCQEAIPGAGLLKGIVQYYGGVAVGSNLAVAIPIELSEAVEIDLGGQGFVQQLNRHDNILIVLPRVLVTNLLQHVERMFDVIALEELDVARQMPRVVEAILGSGRAVQVDPDLEVCRSGPSDSLLQIIGGPLNIWVAVILLKGPVSNRDPDRVEAGTGDPLEIL